MNRRVFFIFQLFWMIVLGVQAQIMEPVHFQSQFKPTQGDEAEIIFQGTIEPGWHVYSTDLGNDGPIEATFNVVKIDGLELVGKLKPVGKVITKYDKMFGMDLKYFEGKATFVQKVRFTKPEYEIDAYLEYGACNDESCMPPTDVAIKQKGKSPVKEIKEQANSQEVEEKELTELQPSPSLTDTVTTTALVAPVAPQDSLLSESLWKPVIKELSSFDGKGYGKNGISWWMILLEGLLGGFLALFTPCVWPIIPMTVSFFLKRNKDRGKAIREAMSYGLSIVVIYVLLGLIVTWLFGASALNALATDAIFNIFFCLLLVVFAASFFGAFEITLPSSWSNKIDQKSENTTGLLSIFLMAFTLALVSFSCTGPIIGFLLVAVSTQGSIIAPTIGMLGFAIALAIPFTLFALFPSWLKSAPKSGGWMNVVKVTLGFIELAFALKFLSVADLAHHWHILDREVFLALWIVIFGLLGVYLLGWLKFPHDDEGHRTNVPQFFLALLSLAFAVYMIPGLWGAPLKAISAFAPPMNTQDFILQKVTTEARFTDYEQGMAAARAEGKPVLIDFTGFGCVNCRKMEAAVWSDVQVSDILNHQYVLISLYVDDKTPLAQPIEVQENGQTRTLDTVGKKWSYLQRMKFGANAQPFYVILDNDGYPLAGSRSYDENVQEYVSFLQGGIRNYKNLKNNHEQ
ncbi:MAG: thioredoxin family protein [Prevotella sp.]|nr:thioredoxin family protein [Prevotella sp.]